MKRSLPTLSLLFFVLVSCEKEPANPEEMIARRCIYNPYEGIDFQTASRVKAISHEHIFRESQVKYAYDRGIRYFACVNYFPACPTYPLSGWSYEYEDYVSPTDLRLAKFTYTGSIPSFVDKNGNVINTDDLVQLPNAEHAFYTNTGNLHFNVLGSLFGECTNGNRTGTEWSEDALGMKKNKWYSLHPKWDIDDINRQYLDESNHLFMGKVFGTINHTSSYQSVTQLLDECPGVFKAIEIVNQGSTESRWEQYRELWDRLLRENRRVWGVSVIDWQTNGSDGKPRLGACNVLLIQDYEGHSNMEKSELGLDAYLSGCFIPSGLAVNDIVRFDVSKSSIRLEVTGIPSQINVVTNRGKTEYNRTSVVEYTYGWKDTYVRFEVWYRSKDGTLEDFLFTNPVFIENSIEE